MPITKPYAASTSSISQLQGTCNTWEPVYKGKTSRIEIGLDDNGKPATLVTYADPADDRDELGRLRLSAGGPHRAYINGVATNIAISREQASFVGFLASWVKHLALTMEHLASEIKRLALTMEHLASQMKHLTLTMEHLASQMKHLALTMEHLASQMKHLALTMEHLASQMKHLASSIKHLASLMKDQAGFTGF